VLPPALDSSRLHELAAPDEATPAALIVDLVTEHVEWTPTTCRVVGGARRRRAIEMMDAGPKSTDPLPGDEWTVLEGIRGATRSSPRDWKTSS
jgi:hypothetical protein